MKEQEKRPVSEEMLGGTPVSGLPDGEAPPPTPRLRARLPYKWMALVLVLVGLGIAAAALVFGVKWRLGPPDALVVSDARVMGEPTAVSPAVRGRIDAIDAREGGRVDKGQTIVRLGTEGLQAEVDKAEARVRAVQSELDDATDALTAARAKMGNVVPQTEARLKDARERLEAARAGERSAVIRAPDRRYLSYQAGSAYVHDTVEARREREYFRAEQDRAKKEISACEARLKAAGAEAAAIMAQEERSEALKGKASEAKAEFAAAKEKLAAAVLVSPVSGVVVKVAGKVGDTVEAGQPLIMVVEPDRMWVEARVGEADYKYIRSGQPVSLKAEAFPQQSFSGKVTGLGVSFSSEVGGLPDSRSPGIDAKPGQDSAVKITVDDPQHILRPGMAMTVKFTKGAGSDGPSGRSGDG